MEASYTSNDQSPVGERIPTISKGLAALQEELERFKTAVEHIEDSRESAKGAADAAKTLHDAVSKLVGPTEHLVAKVDKVDFPSRLDKLDASVAAHGAAIQTTQGRVDAIGVEIGKHTNEISTAISEIAARVDKHAETANQAASSLSESVSALAEIVMRNEDVRQRDTLHSKVIAGVYFLLVLVLIAAQVVG